MFFGSAARSWSPSLLAFLWPESSLPNMLLGISLLTHGSLVVSINAFFRDLRRLDFSKNSLLKYNFLVLVLASFLDLRRGMLLVL